MNLIDGGFQNSNLFLHMPLFDEINYIGQRQDKVRHYAANHEGQNCNILALNIIRNDEKMLWDAIEDLLKRSTQNSIAQVHGVYNFDLLTIDIHKELNTFNHNEITTVIVNSARKLQNGEKKLIKYSSCYGFLQKMIHEDWGKVVFKSSIEVFKDKPVFLDIMVKQLLKDFQFSNDPVILILNDLSANPIYDKDNEQQIARLNAVMKKMIPSSMEFLPEIYIQDKNGIRELLSAMPI